MTSKEQMPMVALNEPRGADREGELQNSRTPTTSSRMPQFSKNHYIIGGILGVILIALGVGLGIHFSTSEEDPYNGLKCMVCGSLNNNFLCSYDGDGSSTKCPGSLWCLKVEGKNQDTNEKQFFKSCVPLGEENEYPGEGCHDIDNQGGKACLCNTNNCNG